MAAREAACKRAAELISEADVFLLCTGAGFSADSGLAVYADVAEVEAYRGRDLKYHDICKPTWLKAEPELFWGFWGQCFNDYRNTPPHEGYEVIDRWVERKFRSSPVAEAIRTRLEELQRKSSESVVGMRPGGSSPAEPYAVTDHAGAFFAFTSNVDAHHFDWFRACEIRECHGNTELYQCGAESCGTAGIWRAPLDFRFAVDKETMLAPAVASGNVSPEQAEAARMPHVGYEAVPVIGHVRGGGRSTTLRYMPSPPPGAKEAGFLSNHPVCTACGGPARPAILMWTDCNWSDFHAQQERWKRWRTAVKEEATAARSQGSPLRLVILEIGAGPNVTTVRSTSESCLHDFVTAGAQARLIRVNLEMPLGDREQYALEEGVDTEYSVEGLLEMPVLSIMGRGLESIQRIDVALAACA